MSVEKLMTVRRSAALVSCAPTVSTRMVAAVTAMKQPMVDAVVSSQNRLVLHQCALFPQRQDYAELSFHDSSSTRRRACAKNLPMVDAAATLTTLKRYWRARRLVQATTVISSLLRVEKVRMAFWRY